MICPFSKPIVGRWCSCEFATIYERCSGKMTCKHEEMLLPECTQLVNLLIKNSRFIIGSNNGADELTHAQSMKIRCGGLIGMQRVLFDDDATPNVRKVISSTTKRYNQLSLFPYHEVITDIQHFSHRKKRV